MIYRFQQHLAIITDYVDCDILLVVEREGLSTFHTEIEINTRRHAYSMFWLEIELLASKVLHPKSSTNYNSKLTQFNEKSNGLYIPWQEQSTFDLHYVAHKITSIMFDYLQNLPVANDLHRTLPNVMRTSFSSVYFSLVSLLKYGQPNDWC